MSSLAVSVVIPTRNRRESLRRLLTALGSQTLSAELFEVIVCDDGSSDGTADAVAASSCEFALRTVSQEPRGRAAACNAGIHTSRGDIILLLDDDMEPAPGLLAAHVRAHAGGPRRAVLGAVPVVFNEASPAVVRHIGRKFERHLQKLARPGYAMGFRDFYSGNSSIRRSVLLTVGLFDEDFTMYGNEDGELALRLMAAGVALEFEAGAVASQHYEKDFARLARDNREKGRTAVLLAQKHPDAFNSLALSTYHAGSRTWRLIRRLLLEMTRVISPTPSLVTFVITTVEKRVGPLSARTYERALEYFYWLGVMDTQPTLLRRLRPSSGSNLPAGSALRADDSGRRSSSP